MTEDLSWRQRRLTAEERAQAEQDAAKARHVRHLEQLSDSELIGNATTFGAHPTKEMEMTRRLKVAVEGLTDELVVLRESADAAAGRSEAAAARAERSAGRLERRTNVLIWLTLAIVALTVAVVVLSAVLAAKG